MALARAVAVRRGEIRRFALALRATVRALKANRVSLDAIVSELAPGLTSRPGIGPVRAAHAIVPYFHAGRCRPDTRFARLAGTSPIEASSGQARQRRELLAKENRASDD